MVKLFTDRAVWVRQITVTSAAAAVAWLIGDSLITNGGLVAAIVASLSTRISVHKSIREGLGQIVGTAIGASIALLAVSVFNFGFITVTGQREGSTWRRAMRSRELWDQLAPQAGIEVLHRGLWVLARRPAAAEVLAAFTKTDMGESCILYSASDAAACAPFLQTQGASAALYSPHELRVESRTAIPLMAKWLQEHCAVPFFWGQTVLGLQGDRV
ncbi:MAG: hypothetical protein EBV69_14710, partial [Oxalobacteraceae bacterium]|nr:hypothetical protein [Oxalobacteraceae bacterium]